MWTQNMFVSICTCIVTGSRTTHRECIRNNQFSLKMTMIILFLTLWNGVKGAQPTITGGNAVVGSDTNLGCTWSESFTKLEWARSSTNETDFSEAEIVVRFTVPDSVQHRDEDKFSFNKDDPEYPLTIKNVTLDDKVRYWCKLETSPLSDGNFFDLSIIVPPAIDQSSVTFDGEKVEPGATITAEEGVSKVFTFRVTGILPAATFEWMVGSKSLSETTVNTTQSDSLITSTSTATWMPAMEDNTKVLTCIASNGAPDNVTINLQVKVTKVLATEEPSTITTTKPATPTTKPEPDIEDDNTVLIVIVSVCGVVVVIVIVGGVVYWFCFKRKSTERKSTERKSTEHSSNQESVSMKKN